MAVSKDAQLINFVLTPIGNNNRLSCNCGNYHLVIMHWPHNHCLPSHVMFMKVILIKMHPYWVSTELITCTSPLTSITFCQLSLNPIAFQTQFYSTEREAPKEHLVQH